MVPFREAMGYETVIGLEVHAQLLTRSKMFCSCSAVYQDANPNTVLCPVCMGMPGVLPVINGRAVALVVRTGLALGCEIASYTKFDRKNYPYPDLMKGYQISQYDLPIASDGQLVIDVEDHEREIRIERVHLEEDVAKLLHRSDSSGETYSLLDINRSGLPLMEIVSAPDMRTPEEARSYLVQLRSILRYIGASTANMEEGSFRCDANISIRPEGSEKLGVKVEVKNMNSFRSVYRALQFEEERQARTLSEGGKIVQETRGWVEERAVTVSMRSKEYASDYRYFPEPDLPPLELDPAWVEGVRAELPELPRAKRDRFVEEYGLPIYDASLLTTSRASADYFESVVAEGGVNGDRPKLAKAVSNWMLGEMARLINESGGDVTDLRFSQADMASLIGMVEDGTLSTTMARTVFEEMFNTGKPPKEIAEAGGMAQISDTDSVGTIVEEVLDVNPDPVRDYLNGKDAAIRFLVGQVMKATRGKANPQLVNQLMKEKLESMR